MEHASKKYDDLELRRHGVAGASIYTSLIMNSMSGGGGNVAPSITAGPTISGTTGEGDTLTASPASVTGVPTPTRTWQWYRDAVAISGATASTYTIVSADLGTDITVVQTETNSEGSDTATSAATSIPGGDDPAFKILVKTDNAGTSASNQFTLPATGTYDVDWGDGNVDTGVSGSQTHTYAVAGEYSIKVTGGLTSITFNNGGDRLKLLEIQNWGDVVWSTFANAYYGCSNMQITASDLPNSGAVTNFSFAWSQCTSLTSFPLIDTSSGTNFAYAWYECNSLTLFPLINTSSGANFSAAWYQCTSLTSFPLINTSSGTIFDFAWYQCTSLTSFPLIDTSSGTSFSNTWRECTSLTSFPLIDTSSGTSFSNAWRQCTSITSFPVLSFALMTTGTGCFQSTTLPTATWSQILINTEAANANNNVSFHGGNSKYSAAAAAARAALIADHTWTITDGGPE